jgi:hypothetical protein
MFGIGGQGNYAEKFAKSANTFHAMGLEPVAKKSGLRFSTVAGLGLLAVAGVMAVGVWDTQRGQV